jgi:hypothetical protein
LIIVAAFERPAGIFGFDDVARVDQVVEQCGGHPGVAEDARPFAESEKPE